MTEHTKRGRGRPRTLTQELIAEIGVRRARGESHAKIATDLRLPVGTSWYGAHLSKLEGGPPQSPLQLTPTPPPTTETSRAESTSSPGEVRA
jgi:hypothetical protein